LKDVIEEQVIYPSQHDQIANDIMTELVKGVKPKKECLSGLSHGGKHEPIFTDPEGIYCGLCGIDLEYND
jgi:hypothetical protein